MKLFIAGKSVLCKEKATQLANSEDTRPVYFITLAGSDARGKPDSKPYYFDMTTKWEFQDTSVVVKDVPDLVREYEQDNPTHACQELTVYDLVAWFVKKNPDSHLIMDEVPLLADASG